jgi:hypothetical protein
MRIAARTRVAVLLLAELAAGPARADDAPAPVREELLSLTRGILDAIALGKADVWERLLAEDAIIIDEFGRKQGKREAVEGLKPLPEGLSGSIELRDARVRAFGDAALVDGELYERETVFGQELVVRYVMLATWVRRGGAWKLAGMEDVTLPTDPPALAVRGLRLDDYPGTYRYGPGRTFTVRRHGDALAVSSGASGKERPLRPVAKDVFSEGSDEKNLLVFQRDGKGRVNGLVERRKYNDLRMSRVEEGGSAK